MRCARCHRRIDPANATTAMGRTFGPTCAQRLGLVTPKRPVAHQLSKFIQSQIFIQDGQAELFQEVA